MGATASGPDARANVTMDAAERIATDAKADAAVDTVEGIAADMKALSHPSRRQFCIAGGAAIVLAGTAALGQMTHQQADAVYVRPPGAESEASLLAKCDRCERCVQACPYDLVQPRPLSFDIPTVGTPEIVYKAGFCDFCMECVRVCPTGALSWDAPTVSDIGTAKVIKDACVAWAWEGCRVCVDVCPVEGALTLDERGRPQVNETLCNGCGLCELECPAPSLRAYDAAAAEKGIYVVSRESAAAAQPGALTTEQFETGRFVRAEGGLR